MSTNTSDETGRNRNSWIWVAGALGTAAGLASLAYVRSRRSPWEKAKQRVGQVADAARQEAKPWMGVVAGAAAGSVALAYWLKPQPTPWEQAGRRTRQIAGRTARQLQPWVDLAATTLVTLAAYKKAQAKKTIGKGAARTADKLTDTGGQLLRHAQRISRETGKQLRALTA